MQESWQLLFFFRSLSLTGSTFHVNATLGIYVVLLEKWIVIVSLNDFWSPNPIHSERYMSAAFLSMTPTKIKNVL